MSGDPNRFTPSSPLVHDLARLCAGVHTRLQVVLHETDRPHPLVPELDPMVVAQMDRLGLSQFIDMPTVPTRQGLSGSSKGRVRLATPESEDASSEEDDPRSSGVGNADLPTQPRVVECSGRTLRGHRGEARHLPGLAGSHTRG